MVNVDRLNKVIDDSGYKRSYLASQLGLSSYGFALKVSGENEFKTSELIKLAELLHYKDAGEFINIFFAQ